MKYFICYLLLLVFVSLLSCRGSIKMIESNEVYRTKAFGFSQAIVANGFLFSSGQVGWDTVYQLTHERSFEDQLQQSFRNIEKLTEAAHINMDHIVHLRFYVKDLGDMQRTSIGTYLSKYYTSGYRPTTTLIGVASLARKDLLVEIEMIAKMP